MKNGKYLLSFFNDRDAWVRITPYHSLEIMRGTDVLHEEKRSSRAMVIKLNTWLRKSVIKEYGYKYDIG